MGRIIEIFGSLVKDGKIWLLLLASLLISIPFFTNTSELIGRILIFAIPSGFAWVILAWVITDKSILRTIGPYLTIFILVFIEKIFFYVFLNLYTEISDWFQYYEIVTNIFMVLSFVSTLFLLLILWYLARPSDFTREKYGFLKNKRILLVIFSTILIKFFEIQYFWYILTGDFPFRFLIENLDYIIWYNLIFTVPTVIGFILFAVVITNIKSDVKYGIYSLIGLSVFIQYFPFLSSFDIVGWGFWGVKTYYFIISIISYFLMFLGLLLVSKSKYVE